jgi:hypothetical protein
MALFDYYNTGKDDVVYLDNINWLAQTFTPSENYTITSVKLLIWRVYTPGTVTVSIKAVDIDGKPTGDDLCSGTINGNTLSESDTDTYTEITFGDGCSLTSGTQYAIVVRSAAGTVEWDYDNSTPAYAGGMQAGSLDGGSSWAYTYDGGDFMFETYGTATEMVAVPDIVGMTQAAAESALTEAGLIEGDVTTAYSNAVVVDLIISQDPAAETVVDVGSAVNFVISLGPRITSNTNRPEGYNPDVAWDEETRTWVGVASSGGGRYGERLIAVGTDDNEYGVIYWGGV